jgi:hypothetical protein
MQLPYRLRLFPFTYRKAEQMTHFFASYWSPLVHQVTLHLMKLREITL